jgi:hypothetical protein
MPEFEGRRSRLSEARRTRPPAPPGVRTTTARVEARRASLLVNRVTSSRRPRNRARTAGRGAARLPYDSASDDVTAAQKDSVPATIPLQPGLALRTSSGTRTRVERLTVNARRFADRDVTEKPASVNTDRPSLNRHEGLAPISPPPGCPAPTSGSPTVWRVRRHRPRLSRSRRSFATMRSRTAPSAPAMAVGGRWAWPAGWGTGFNPGRADHLQL